MAEHPPYEMLERLLRAELSAPEVAELLPHLSRCRECAKAMAPTLELLFGGELPEPTEEEVAEHGAAYDGVIGRGIERLFGDTDPSIVEARAEEAVAAEVREVLASGGIAALHDPAREHLQGPGLCRGLLDRSAELRHDDPAQMLELTRMAVITADNLAGAVCDAARATDLRARTRGELANALRVNGDLAAAEVELERAYHEFAMGSESPELAARLLSLHGSLLGDQRHFERAVGLLYHARSLYLELGEVPAATRTLVNEGLYCDYAGWTDQALRLLHEAHAEIGPDTEPVVALSAAHNLARLLMETEVPELARKARAMLFRQGPNYAAAGRVIQLKRTWLEGQIHVVMNEPERAERDLTTAVEGLRNAGLGYCAALAALDLAAVLLQLGRASLARELIEQAAEAFLARGVEREALASIALLRRAARSEIATAELVRKVARRLRRAEHHRSARVEPDA